MRLFDAVVAAAFVAACGHAPPPVAGGPGAGSAAGAGSAMGSGASDDHGSVEVAGYGECAHYAYLTMPLEAHAEYDGPQLETAVDGAQSAALDLIDKANAADEAGRSLEAAHDFLACAQRFAAVPDGDPMIDTAKNDAQLCYYNAIYAYANAGRFAAEGKAALEAAAKADPRDAAYIAKELHEAPSDCVSAPPAAPAP